MKKILISALIAISCSVQAQDFLAAENDTTVLTEYNDGRLWAYRQIGDYVVGMTNYVGKDDYGKNYQILIFIKNLGETSALFDPSLVTSTLVDKQGESKDMKVYTYERYMKKVKNQQAWAMALAGFAAGLNAGSLVIRQHTQLHTEQVVCLIHKFTQPTIMLPLLLPIWLQLRR